MRKRAVKFITVFFLSLVLVVTCPLFGFQSEAADGVYVFREQSPNVIGTAYTPGDLYVGFGETLDYTLSFGGANSPVDSPKMCFYFFKPKYFTNNNSNSADNWYTVWVDNWRMTIGGNTYKVSYLADSTSVFNIPLPANASFHYLIECDVHFRLNNAANLPNQEVRLNETHTEQSTSTSTTNTSGRTTTNTNTSGSSTMHGYASDAIAPVYVCPIVKVELNHSGDSFFDYTENTYVTDAQQQALTQQQTQQQHSDAQNQLDESKKQTQQQHSDAQNQLDESKKQTDAMTKFDGRADMDKNSSDLNNSLSDYDDAQQSIFTSSSTAINNFDFENLFIFQLNINSAIGVWNSLMISIVASMGDFALIYTISMGLVFISIIVGIWRYFVK